MLFHTHILLGLIAFLFLENFFSGGSEIIFLFLVLLGSILPDLDREGSKINRWGGIVGIIAAALAKHRGFFHSLLFHFPLFFIVGIFFNHYYASALFLGYLTHVLGDGVTPAGIRLLYPFFEIKINGPLRVGSLGEGMVLVGLFILIVKYLL